MSAIAACGLLIGLLNEQEPEIAYIARFYNPAPVPGISTDQVYLSDFRGTCRRRLSATALEKHGIAWSSSATVCWVERGDRYSRLVLYDRVQRRRRVLARGRTISLQTTGTGVNVALPVYKIDEQWVQVSGTQIAPMAAIPELSRARWWSEAMCVWLPDGQPMVRQLGFLDGKGGLTPTPLVDRDQKSTWVLEREGRQYLLYLGGWSLDIWPAANGRSWLLNMFGGASCGSSESLYLMNWATGKFEGRIEGVTEIDVRGKAWAGIEAWRPLSRYVGNRQVWTHQLYAGDWRAGQRWLVAAGLVDCSEVALSP